MTVRPATHRTANVARWACRILGVLFVATSPIAVFSGDTASRWHTLLHFVTGLVALYAGFRGGAKLFCLVFGAGYLTFGALGLALGDPAADRGWHVGPLHLMTGDHLFHVVLGTVVLAAGIVTRSRRTA
ncbi:DUF4383 domain-containing protein [Amycolatopsis sp. NBC_00438]|uniref:DUF4383 domain-containing protein n=1 Tax=Amycolatopsis sp. NBC_00438 TaxID=2903558 RepID=UPI002E1B1DAF